MRRIRIIALAALISFGVLSLGFGPAVFASQGVGVPRNVELLHWSEVREILPLFTPIQIFDVGTGIIYYVLSLSNGNHADVETLTPQDTLLLFQSFDWEQTWSGRPVWVTIGDRVVAAAIHSMPHDIYTIRDNNLDGHICLHFYGSTTHAGNLPRYLEVVQEAYRLYHAHAMALPIVLPTLLDEPPPPAEITQSLGLPSAHDVRVNGQLVAFTAFNIDGSNFFRLRDVAFAVNGTRSQFDVVWDEAMGAINILPGRGYVAVGTEMARGGGQAAPAMPSLAQINVAGQRAGLRAYNIEGYTYFMLRDLGAALGFVVYWDDAQRTVLIDTQ